MDRKVKEEGCDREMVARRFPEPAAELIRLVAWRSGELRRGVSGSRKGFYSSPAGLRHALVRHGHSYKLMPHCLRSDPKTWQTEVCACVYTAPDPL